MKISVEEVSRLLTVSANDRHTSTLTVSPALERDVRGREAAQVNVSSAAQDIISAKKYLNQVPDVRAARVQALKAQIENGTYHVSGEDIADLMIRRTLADSTTL